MRPTSLVRGPTAGSLLLIQMGCLSGPPSIPPGYSRFDSPAVPAPGESMVYVYHFGGFTRLVTAAISVDGSDIGSLRSEADMWSGQPKYCEYLVIETKTGAHRIEARDGGKGLFKPIVPEPIFVFLEATPGVAHYVRISSDYDSGFMSDRIVWRIESLSEELALGEISTCHGRASP